MKFFFNKSKTIAPPAAVNSAGEEIKPADKTQEEIASVIALAIHMYITQVREYENSIITIQKIMKPYSPWSSKIYGLRPQHSHTAAIKPKLK